ncbi:MAG: methylmalonyl-CoA epimerase [Candidatus Eisenbacteria bacterium]|nr:methylmalonyl-CoA epimerase [Candidatus Eisenbacteria bacterium]
MSESRAKATRVDHISIVVEDFDRAYDFYANLLGLKVLKVEESELHGVKAAFLKVGDVMIEIIQPLGEGAIADFLERRGPGFHHLAFEVPDLSEALLEVSEAGVRVIGDPKPGIHGGRISFLHPKSTQGAMIELCDMKTFEGDADSAGGEGREEGGRADGRPREGSGR